MSKKAKKTRKAHKSAVEFIKKRSAKKVKRKASLNPMGYVTGAMKGQAGELASILGPALGAYVATRIGARVLRNIIGKAPFLAKHAGPLSNIAILAGALWATNRSKSLRRYRTQIVIGAAISAIQSLLKNYIPGLGNLLDESTATPGSKGALGDAGWNPYGPPRSLTGADGLSGGDGGPDAGVEASLREITWVTPQVPGATTDGASDADLYTGAFTR